MCIWEEESEEYIMEKSTNYEELLKDGFTKKFAKYYLDILEEEKKNPIFSDKEYVDWAHKKGFTAEFAYVLGLNEKNYMDYLSQYDFYKVWPLNSWSRIWVNDKLTLKYTLSKSEFSKYMPKYYYYSTQNGLRPLMDNPNKGIDSQSFLDTLVKVGEFACKPCNGTQSTGFFKLSYCGKNFAIDDFRVSERDIVDFIDEHPNYVFTEYLRPSKEWAVYGEHIHTVRIMILNENGNNPQFIGNYIRIPNEESGSANYIMHDGTNNGKYNLYLSINMENGEYGQALAIYPDKVIPLEKHPDTGALLSGRIECIEELKKVSLDISNWFNNVEFFGFDFGFTSSGIKIMEINTHPAVMVSQIRGPLYLNSEIKQYFEKKLKIIDEMSVEEREKRNNILR